MLTFGIEELGPQSGAGHRSTRVPQPPEQPLCARLKAGTRQAHLQLEAKLGLPRCIASLEDYQRCLIGFYRLYAPLEASLARFPQWPELGLNLAERSRAPWLLADLRALGAIAPAQLAWAPDSALPALPGFASALGALYVLEGSTLGARFILLHLEGIFGSKLAGANAFFAAHGERNAAMWNDLKSTVDRFGAAHPAQAEAVIAGAAATFQAVEDWMPRGS